MLRWIATYPLDKVIRSLNNWGKVNEACSAELAVIIPCLTSRERNSCFIEIRVMLVDLANLTLQEQLKGNFYKHEIIGYHSQRLY